MGVLINNVGISYPGALYFHEVEKYAPNLTRDMVSAVKKQNGQMRIWGLSG